MKIFAVAMVRNEIDIIQGFLKYNHQIFDHIILADMQSSDGTSEVVENFTASTGKVERIVYPCLAYHQSEIITALSKRAFEKGADWVFCLDADEFLQVSHRQDLEQKLATFGGEVMHMPWLNLIPKTFGTFSQFDLLQDFYWSGEYSTYTKIAVSSHYAQSHPNYVISAGNHNISSDLSQPAELLKLGLPLMHIPVRSVERARFKAANALDLQRNAINHVPGDGFYHQIIRSAFDGDTVTYEVLAGLADDYGNSNKGLIDPQQAGYPMLKLDLLADSTLPSPARGISSVALRRLDEEQSWQSVNSPANATTFARIADGMIEILPQPICGDLSHGPQSFTALPDQGADGAELGEIVADILTGLRLGLIQPPENIFSAWTDLVPTLGMLFSLLKPRRYVELGVHNGMSYLSACRFSEHLNLGTQCVAVDSWEGDPHAGFHAQSVFDSFKQALAEKYPDQIFIKGYFDEAAKLFEEGSIDLLHIDGFHSYEAVKHDFETWLSKLSSRGVMIFHDTNVHERDFGVWRFWAEVSDTYPHVEIYHGHGLGILYVGSAESPVANLFQLAKQYPDFVRLGISFLESQAGEAAAARQERHNLSVSARQDLRDLDCLRAELSTHVDQLQSELYATKAQLAVRTSELNMVLTSKAWKRGRIFRRLENSIRKRQGKEKKVWPKPVP